MKFVRIALCATVLAAASVAMGQTKPGDIVVDVPFAFVAGGQTLPAGHYIVAAMDDNVRIFNSQTTGLYLSTHSASRNATDGTKLVFHRYGDTYFLSAMWVGGNAIGRELPRSRAERKLEARTAEMELAVVRPEKLRPEESNSGK
jgi:hypothetical protein